MVRGQDGGKSATRKQISLEVIEQSVLINLPSNQSPASRPNLA